MGTYNPSGPALEIRNLRVDYGSFTAVHDLSLSLEPGEIFGLAGPNGAGKTSTIRVLATLLEPTYGEVDVAGYDLFEDPEKVHALLGYMPDLAPVVPDLKVWEFLDLHAASFGYRGSEKQDRIDSVLKKVKLEDKRDVYGSGLSRGMTQRVVLAKTLMHEPKLLLLDEPASGMDPLARRDMRVILQELAAEGAAVVISSHILSELSDLCTSVGIMHLGHLLQYGAIDAVVGSLDAELIEIQMELLDGVEVAVEFLERRSDVGSIRVESRKLVYSFEGDGRARSVLLRELVAHGVDVTSFTPGKSGIESLLMSLVEENVE